MEEHSHIPYLREVVIFLVASAIVVPVFHRFRLSPVLGFLIVGALIGPYGLGLWIGDMSWISLAVISDIEGIRPLADLGVIFLLFTIGLELSFKRLWAMRRLVFSLGSLQVVSCAIAIGAIAWQWGNPVPASIIIGACLALSSTAIVMQLLMERRAVATPLGNASFSILLFQDIAVVPILFAVGFMGAQTASNAADAGTNLLLDVVQAILVLAAIFIVGRLLLRPLFRLASRANSREIFMAASLLVVLGAFLAGLLLAGSEFSHQIETNIEPFKGLLLGLFFMTVGMGIDFRVFAEHPGWLLLSVAGLVAIKAAAITSLCLAFGLPRHGAFEAGLLLAQAGEFAFVIVGLAFVSGLIPADSAQFMLIVASITMMITPLIAEAGERIGKALKPGDDARCANNNLAATEVVEGHIIVVGFGRVGQMLGRILDREAIRYFAFDTDGESIAHHRDRGLPVFLGDGAQVEMLKLAGAERAAALVVTMDDAHAAEQVVQTARQLWPAIHIYVRARDAAQSKALLEMGATYVVPETLEASLQLGFRVLCCTGASEDDARRRIDLERRAEMGIFREAAADALKEPESS
ncbi:MAG: cation:proton antiporter [Proteobacteria bacterium]|nr:cation:proton antiporter [Pseudomonadota bacterium]